MARQASVQKIRASTSPQLASGEHMGANTVTIVQGPVGPGRVFLHLRQIAQLPREVPSQNWKHQWKCSWRVSRPLWSQLMVVNVRIQARGAHEFVVCAASGDASLIQDQDEVRHAQST